jgi:CRISPR/Cas system-associated exonuclease Cas4 (RecB family)
MIPFLQHTANDLYARYGNKINDLSLVFPSRRAQLYFTEYLSKLSGNQEWMPTITSIDDIFADISGLQLAEHYHLIAMLYKSYSDCYRRDENFDHFYPWGEMMLGDFDSIDKYRVDAQKLFAGMQYSKMMDGDFSFLSPEQQKLVQSFWDSFSAEKNTPLQENFINLWSALLPIYKHFGEQLLLQNAVYQGLMLRKAAEKLKKQSFDFGTQHFVFIGLNALNECEKVLLHHLKKDGRADFYWDYDEYYINDEMQEAGKFMRYNLQHFPPATPLAPADCFAQNKDIQVIAAPTDALQTKLLPQMLDEVRGDTPLADLDRNTAIVLIDEGLLIPALYALPAKNDRDDACGIAAFNITMGYPLRQTPVYGLIELLARLHKNARTQSGVHKFYYKDVLTIIQHRYVKSICPQQIQAMQESIVQHNHIYIDVAFFAELPNEIKDLFVPQPSPAQFCSHLNRLLMFIVNQEWMRDTEENKLHNEYIICAYGEITKLHSALLQSGLELSLPMFMNLLCTTLRSIKIPFDGDPIEGVQIMGILETHAIDFQQLIVLSLNEETMSYRNNTASFIPYNLRRAFDLPTMEQYDALYGYYFYRLLQRAQHIRLLYNSQTEGIRSGEMSRYLRQLQMESPHQPPVRNVSYSIGYRNALPISIPKNDEVMRILQQFLKGGNSALSATSLQRFLACPLQFYFAVIVKIQPPNEVTEDIDGRMLGDIFHNTMHVLYSDFVQKEVDEQILQQILNNADALETLVLEQVANIYFKDKSAVEAVKSNGKLWLVKQIVQKYAVGVLRYDLCRAQQTPFVIKGLEQPVNSAIASNINGLEQAVQFKGYIDRIDETSHGIKVIDYKTGKFEDRMLRMNNVESLFGGENEQRKEIFQALLYSLVLHREQQIAGIEPALYFLRNIYRTDFDHHIKNGSEIITDATPFLPQFQTELQNLLANIFDPQQNFVQTDNRKTCDKCAFVAICHR